MKTAPAAQCLGLTLLIVTAGNASGQSSLVAAVAARDRAAVRASLSGRPVPCRNLQSALHLAVRGDDSQIARLLIDAGADPNDLRTGFTPLHMLPGVRKPDSSDGSDGAAPQGAGRMTSLDFVREIVKRGANVNLRLPRGTPKMPATSSMIATEGATPLLFAADRSDVPLMRLLLELGADLSDDAIASCQIHQGFGISSCRCSASQSSPSPATAWAEGRQLNGAPSPAIRL